MKTAPYKQPYKGKQTVQEYHPERGDKYYYQVSTYTGSNGWLISFCSPIDLEKTKRIDKERARKAINH